MPNDGGEGEWEGEWEGGGGPEGQQTNTLKKNTYYKPFSRFCQKSTDR